MNNLHLGIENQWSQLPTRVSNRYIFFFYNERVNLRVKTIFKNKGKQRKPSRVRVTVFGREKDVWQPSCNYIHEVLLQKTSVLCSSLSADHYSSYWFIVCFIHTPLLVSSDAELQIYIYWILKTPSANTLPVLPSCQRLTWRSWETLLPLYL